MKQRRMEPFLTKSFDSGYEDHDGPIINQRLKNFNIRPVIEQIFDQTIQKTPIEKKMTFTDFEDYVVDFDLQRDFCNDPNEFNSQALVERFWQQLIYADNITSITSTGAGWISIFKGQKDESQNASLVKWLEARLKTKGIDCDLQKSMKFMENEVSWFSGSTLSFQTWMQGPFEVAQIHYLHKFSNARIWYGISPDSANCMKELLRDSGDKILNISSVQSSGIKVSAMVQEPGSILVTSPGAFYCFINCGFNLSESFVYFPIQWVSSAHRIISNDKKFPHIFTEVTVEEILFLMVQQFLKTRRCISNIEHCTVLIDLIRQISSREKTQRHEKLEFVSSSTKLILESQQRSKCLVCKKFIYLSAIFCMNDKSYTCLHCFDKQNQTTCNSSKGSKSLLFNEEMENMLNFLDQCERWINQYRKWKRRVKRWNSHHTIHTSQLDDRAVENLNSFTDKKCETVIANELELRNEKCSNERTTKEVLLDNVAVQHSKKPSLEELKDVILQANSKGFVSDSMYASLRIQYEKALQFDTTVECILHPDLLKAENERLKSSSFSQPVLTISVDDLDAVIQVGEKLICHFPQLDELRELSCNFKELRQDCWRLINESKEEDCETEKFKALLQKSKHFPIHDNVFPRMEKILQRNEWLSKVTRLIGQSDSSPQSLHVWDDVLFSGRNLSCLSDRVRSIYEEMSLKMDEASFFNNRAAAILSYCRGDSGKKTSAKKIDTLLRKAKEIPILMPKVKALRDVFEKVRLWLQDIEVPNDNRQVFPFLSRLEKLCEEGDRLPLSLPQLPQLRTQVIAAQSWRDRVARFFTLKNSTSTISLLQALMPRSANSLTLEINNGRSGRRRRRGHAPSANAIAQATDECARRFVELVDAVDLRNEVSMDLTQERLLKIYKEMALSEYQGMLKLRLFNQEKADKDDDDVVYCICKRADGSGFMLQCDLCKEWYHGQCISLPRKLQGKSNSKSETMHNAVKDMKYLCPCCERSRRPTLDSVLSLLLASQKLPVRLVEGSALECLAERAVQWQDNTQGFLVSTTEIAKAFSCYCKMSNVQLPDNLMHQLRLKLTYPDVERPQTRSYLSSESGSHLHQLQSKMRAAMAASRTDGILQANPSINQTVSNFQSNQSNTTILNPTNRPNPSLRTPSVGPSGMRKHMRKTPLLPRSDSLEGHGLDSLSHSSIGSVSGGTSLSNSPPNSISTNIGHGSSVPVSGPYNTQLSSPMIRGHINQGSNIGPSFAPIPSRPQVIPQCPSVAPTLQLSREVRREMEDKLLEGDLIELQMDEKTWLWDMICLSAPLPTISPGSSPISNPIQGCLNSDPSESSALPAPVIARRRVSSGSTGPPVTVISSNDRPCVAPRVKAEKEERLKRQRLQQWDLEQHGIAYSSSSSDSEINIRPSLCLRKNTKEQDDDRDGMDEDYDSDTSTGSNISPRRKVISFYRQGGVARPVFGKRRSSSSDSSFDIETQAPPRPFGRTKDNPATAAYRPPRMNQGSRSKKPGLTQQTHQSHSQNVRQPYPVYGAPSTSKGLLSNNVAQNNSRLQDPMSPPTYPPPRRKRKMTNPNAHTVGKSTAISHNISHNHSVHKRLPPQTAKTASSDEDSSSGGEVGDYISGVCSVAFCERPSAKVVQWIQCDKCKKWYHFQCIGLRNKTDAGRTYVCLRCKQREANAHDNFYYGRR